MPVSIPQWTEFLSCQVCFHVFDEEHHRPISLACGHTVCRTCLCNLPQKRCPFDQNIISRDIAELPVNYALLQLVGAAVPETENTPSKGQPDNVKHYNAAKRCIEELALHLKPINMPNDQKNGVQNCTTTNGTEPSNGILSRPMQRKLVTLVNCQLVEEEGRARAVRAARSLGERTVTELILQHQNPQQLSANLWAAVRARGCQFLGPAMQEEVLKLILLALEDGSALSRKVLVLFVVQRLEKHYPQASKTAIGHVVQLLYRASCFKVSKREEESSLMQLKEEFRTYDALRREHDSQIVQIAMEAGLRIAPDQWSSLLYGDTGHKSHMQSIIDKLQTPQSFSQSVNELIITLQRTGDPCVLQRLQPQLEFLASVDPNPDSPAPSWENLEAVMKAIKTVVQGLVDFIQNNGSKHLEVLSLPNLRYKTSMCRDLAQKGNCPRGGNCTFAHSQDELEKYRARNKKLGKGQFLSSSTSALTPREKMELETVTKTTAEKLMAAEISRNVANGIDTISEKMHTMTTPSQVSRELQSSPEHQPRPTNMGVAIGQPEMTPTAATPHLQTMAGPMNPSVATYPPAPGFPPDYYQACGSNIPMMNFPRMMGYGAPCYQHPIVPPQYRPPMYGMMPPQQYSFQPGMDYNMPPRCQHPPPYAGSYIPYDVCQQQHSSLNPYADSFVVGTAHTNQQYCCHPEEYRCMSSQGGQNPVLKDLHHRRNEILSKLNIHKSGSSRGSAAETCMAEWGSEKSTGRSSLDQSLPDITCKIQALSSKESASGWESDYHRWSCGETTSSMTKPLDSQMLSPDLVVDGSEVWNESGSETTDFMLNWLKDIPDDPAPIEPGPIPIQDVGKPSRAMSKPAKVAYTPATSYQQQNRKSERPTGGDNSERDSDGGNIEYRRLSIASDGDDNIIPFDHAQPIVSKFGPISRNSAKASSEACVIRSVANPVQVNADENLMTSVTSSLRSKPQVFPTNRMPTRTVNQPISAVLDVGNTSTCSGYNNLMNYPPNVKICVKKEIARLEEKALNADTEDEWLACELQAVELQISLQTSKASGMSPEDLTGTKHWGKSDRAEGGRNDWTDYDKALHAQEMETECLRYRKRQEKEDRLLAQKLVLEEHSKTKTGE